MNVTELCGSDSFVSRLVLATIALAVGAEPCGAASARYYLSKPGAWHVSAEGRKVAGNILSWQSHHGGWPKNTDTTTKPFTGDPKTLQGTFDNGATTDELRFLAAAYRATKSRQYEQAFAKGVAHILAAQYPTGGWPQFHPPSRYYHRHITFNDNAMVRLMRFLRDVAGSADYAFLRAPVRKAAQASFDRGVQCILKCQIVVNSKRTVWCAQHDERTLEPRQGRSYELVSLSGGESVGVLRLLMSIDDPSQGVVDAVVAGAKWYESAKVSGEDLRAVGVQTSGWARFYDIPTNRPIFSGRDGVKKFNIKEIESERAKGYMWWGQFGNAVANDYKKWRQRRRDNPRILIQGTGLIPSQLKGTLKTAYASLANRRYGPAAVTLKRFLDKPDAAGKKEFETAGIIMKLVKHRAALAIGRLDKLEKIGDYYSLSLWLNTRSRSLQGLPSFDERYKRWQAERGCEKWQRAIKAGHEYNRLMLAADRKVTAFIINRLEDFAARQADSLYGNAAIDAATKFKAKTKESASAIRKAYFKRMMAR